MTEEEKKAITRERYPGRVAQGYKLAALMEKRKEEILRNKEQSTEQSTAQSNDTYMALAYLPSLPQVFEYFLNTTRRQDMNNLLNQKDDICLKSDDDLIE